MSVLEGWIKQYARAEDFMARARKIDTAMGKDLDELGKRSGIKRDLAESDFNFRERVKVKQSANAQPLYRAIRVMRGE